MAYMAVSSVSKSSNKKNLLVEVKKNMLVYLLILQALIFVIIFNYIPLAGLRALERLDNDTVFYDK